MPSPATPEPNSQQPQQPPPRAASNGSARSALDRELPHDLDAERAVLGSMLLEPAAISEAILVLQDSGPEAFWNERHKILFEQILHLWHENRPIDDVVIRDELKRSGRFDSIGGYDFLAECVNSVASHFRVREYAQIVRDKFLLRQLIRAASKAMDEAFDDRQPTPRVLDNASKYIFEVTERGVSGNAQMLPEIIDQVFRQIEANDGSSLTGEATGYYQLDEITCGFQPAELIIIAGRPSMGKCVASDTEIVQADGSVQTIEEICKRRSAALFSLDDDWKIRAAVPSDFIDDGIKPVFRVATRLGRRVDVTLSHPFRCLDGWKPLGELRVGDCIALPRSIPAFGEQPLRECEVKLLAYFIGDGGLTGASPRFTNSNPAIMRDFRAAVREFGGAKLRQTSTRPGEALSLRVRADSGRVERNRRGFANRLRTALRQSTRSARNVAQAVGVSAGSVTNWTKARTVPDSAVAERLCAELEIAVADLLPDGTAAARHNEKNAITKWLDAHGLMGKGAGEKRIPSAVFTLPREQLALFLNRLFATDGWASVLASGQAQLGYSTVCESLARQVQHLLLRFGVIASLKSRSVLYQGKRRPCWQIDVTDALSIARFLDEIGIHGKSRACDAVSAALAKRRYQTNNDLMPVEVWKQIDAARRGVPWREVARRMGLRSDGSNLHVGVRSPTRARLLQFATALDDGSLRQLAESDVYWDEIKSIEPLGPKQVYDLTVPGTHNFVAADIFVHNTALGLNIAEHMALTEGRPVLFFSLEMSKQQVAQRILCSRARVDAQKLRRGRHDDRDMQRLQQVADEIRDKPLLVDDTSSLTILELRARARIAARKHQIRAIFVDYLQLMHIPGSESRQMEVAEVSRGLKALAKELSVPVVAMAQLNRKPADRSGNRPMMSDLRESGAIEQDADVITLLHRESYYTRPNEAAGEAGEDDNKAELIIAKQRNGPVGTIDLHFNRQWTRFDNPDVSGRYEGAYEAQGASRSVEFPG